MRVGAMGRDDIEYRDQISRAMTDKNFAAAEAMCQEWIELAQRGGEHRTLAEAFILLAESVEAQGRDGESLRFIARTILEKQGR